MSAVDATATASRSRQGWTHWFNAQRGLLSAVAIFALMFAFYGWKQEVGLTASIINTAARSTPE